MTKKSINQQQTVFMFRSLRQPELINPVKEKERFVFPQATGTFITAVKNRPAGQSKAEAMRIASTSFVPYTLKEMETKFTAYNPVANQIARTKSNFDATELYNRIKPLTAIVAADVIKLWDNLYYQIVTQKDFYIKEKIAELLILQNIIENAKIIKVEPDIIKALPAMANAKAVLTTELFDDKGSETEEIKENENPIFSTKALDKVLEISLAESAINRAEMAIQELEKYYRSYQQSYSDDYNDYNTDYNNRLQKAYKDATLVTKERVECPSGCIETYQEYENLILPEYNFQAPIEVDDAILSKFLSAQSYYVVTSLGLSKLKTVSQIINGIEVSIGSNSYKIFNTEYDNRQGITVGTMSFMPGGLTEVNPFISANQVPYISTVDLSSKHNQTGHVKIILDTGYYGADIVKASYTLYDNGNEIANSDKVKTKSYGTILDTTLFPDGKGTDISGNDMKLTSRFTLADATSIELSIPVRIGDKVSGVGKVDDFRPSKEVAPLALKNFGVKRIGIADYKKVVAEVCCYREAEVSHIENIMAREFKSKSTTRERIEETTVTTETETETENLTDTVSTERYEMQNEVAKIIEQDKQTAGYANVSGSAYGVTFEAGGSYATNNAKAESNRQAVIESKEITQRAMERIVTRFRKEVTTKITESYKEENSHIFDNRAGENHVSGVYRFINAVYKNQIYNYGKRLMYEFMIPQPSKLYRYGMTVVPGMPPSEGGFERPMPIAPPTPTINNATDLSLYNYVNEAAKYGADTEAPPAANITIGKSYQGKGQDGSHSNNFNDIKVPDGYISNSATYQYAQRKSNNNNLRAQIMIGNNTIEVPNQETKSGNVLLIPSFYSSDTIPVSVVGWDLGSYALNVSVNFSRNEEIFRAWQVKTFNAIRAAYNAKLEEYYRLMGERREQATQPNSYLRGNNPLFYRQIEQITLKKYCIAYLMPENNMGQGFHSGNSFINDIINGINLDNYASLVKFLEQAFEWNIMSYNFYPYYWGNRQNWTELYQSEDDDPVFRSFMQSGMARVIVTVRPGFEDAVMYFRSTGQIWNGQTTPVLGDPLYLGITDELKEQEYIVEETWETLVPTALTALQRSGVAIDVDGLPCGGGCEDPDIQNPLVPNKSQLGPEIPPVQ